MQLVKKYGLLESNRVFLVKIANIHPNPAQPRRIFDSESLLELAESIREFGVLQPLTVRKMSGYYELVAGERRLRASRLAGLDEAPCILIGVDEKQSSLIALVENLQRQDLDVFEEAAGIATLIRNFGLSQEEAARRLGLSQSAVANKLRLLRHSKNIVEKIRECGLTERHARALLRLESDEDRHCVLEEIWQHQMNVAQTDEYITHFLERKLMGEPKDPPETEQNGEAERLAAAQTASPRGAKLRTLYLFKDVRLFLNSIMRAVDVMRRSGVETLFDKEEDAEEIVLTIKIPKNGGASRAGRKAATFGG